MFDERVNVRLIVWTLNMEFHDLRRETRLEKEQLKSRAIGGESFQIFVRGIAAVFPAKFR